jgi:hypothetical protein
MDPLGTLMVLWLATGHEIPIRTSAENCTFAIEAVAGTGAVVVTLPSGLPVPVVKVACYCADPGDLEP